MVPVGSNERGIVYLNLAAWGCVRVAGGAAERRALLRSWLATLESTHAPGELAMRLDRESEEALGTAPSLGYSGGAAPPDSAELARELSELDALRAGGGGDAGRPLLALLSPGEAGAGALDRIGRRDPAAAMAVVLSLAALPDGEGEEPAGAAVLLGGAGDPEVGGGPGEGEVTLRAGREPPIRLDPVTVRREARAAPAAGEASGASATFREAPGGDPEPEIRDIGERPGAGGEAGAAPGASDAFGAPAPSPEAPDGDPEPDMRQVAEPAAVGDGAGAAHAAGDGSGVAEPSPGTSGGDPERAGPPDREGEPVFRVQCLGPLRVWVNGAPLERWRLGKAREMLAFLAVQGGAAAAR